MRFPRSDGIVPGHSRSSTAWAPVRREIQCLGVAHADSFHSPVPGTEDLAEQKVRDRYEENTGHAIMRQFAPLDVLAFPAVLLAGHARFVLGRAPEEAVEYAVVFMEVGALALHIQAIHASRRPIPVCLRDKHFLHKYGARAYYDQFRQLVLSTDLRLQIGRSSLCMVTRCRVSISQI